MWPMSPLSRSAQVQTDIRCSRPSFELWPAKVVVFGLTRMETLIYITKAVFNSNARITR